MKKRLAAYLGRLKWITLTGLIFGLALGYVASNHNWGFGYLLAIPLTLGCACGIEVLDIVAGAYIYPNLEKYPRGRKLVLHLSISVVVHIGGWLLLVGLAGRILGFSLFQWEVLIWLVVVIIRFTIVTSSRQAVNFYNELVHKDLLEERLKALATQAEFKALKAQINPHFLFNSSQYNRQPHTTTPRKPKRPPRNWQIFSVTP